LRACSKKTLVLALGYCVAFCAQLVGAEFESTFHSQAYDEFWDRPLSGLDWVGETNVAVPYNPGGTTTNGILLNNFNSRPIEGYLILDSAEMETASRALSRLNEAEYHPLSASKERESLISLEPWGFGSGLRERSFPYFAEVQLADGQTLIRSESLAEGGSIGSDRSFTSFGRVNSNLQFADELTGDSTANARGSVSVNANFKVFHDTPFRLTTDVGVFGDAIATFSLFGPDGTLFEHVPASGDFDSFQLEGVLSPGDYRIETAIESQSGGTPTSADDGGGGEYWFSFRALVPERVIENQRLAVAVPEPLSSVLVLWILLAGLPFLRRGRSRRS